MSFVLHSKVFFAERPAVEAHIVEVCPFVIDDVKAVGTCFVPCKLIRKPLPISMKSRLPVMAVKRFPLSAVISSWLSYLLFLGF